MKKVFTFFAFAAFSIGAYAQQVPNGSFETWTNDTVPDYWSTWANVIGLGEGFPYFALKDTTTFADGHTSVKLITDTIPSTIAGQPTGNPITPSLLGLGAMIFNFATMQPSFTGIAYTKRPDSLYFSVKYAPAIPADSAEVVFNLTKSTTSLFGGLLGGVIANTQNQWVPYAFDLASYYSSGNLPDTLVLFFSSSTDTGRATMGSTLWVDAVHFDASVTTGILPISGNVHGVNAYPNPATDKLNIAVEQDEIGSQIQLFDMTGREVYNGIIASATSTIDTHGLEAGVYAIRVNSIDKLTTYKGKITITK